MDQRFNLRLLNTEARLQTQVSPFGIRRVKSDIGTGFCPSTSVFPCPCHSPGAPYFFIYHRLYLIAEVDRVVK
jgi:hypothetical protein